MMRRCSWLLISFALLAGCATAPKPEVPRTPSYAFAAPSSTPLGREIAGKRQAAGGQSGLFLLGQGVEAFSARAGLARRATRTLDVQYYAIFVDDAGSLLLEELVDAARRSRAVAARRFAHGRSAARSRFTGVGSGNRGARFQPICWAQFCAGAPTRIHRRRRATQSPHA